MTNKLHPSDLESVILAYENIFPVYANARADYEGQGASIARYAAANRLLHVCQDLKKLTILDIGCGMGHDMKALPETLKSLGYKGKIICQGCDLTPSMVKHCVKKKMDVIQGDLLVLHQQKKLSASHLVWANFSLIHVQLNCLRKYYAALHELTLPGGVVGVGFKTGYNVESIDPADNKISYDRFTSFLRIGTAIDLLRDAGYSKWLCTVEVPPSGGMYTYAHVLMKK